MRKIATRALFVFAVGLYSPAAGNEHVALQVRPQLSLEPATLLLDVFVQRDADNRAVRVSVESADYYRSSLMPLDGADGPRTSSVMYENVPAGVYEATAELFGSADRRLAITSRRIEVRGR